MTVAIRLHNQQSNNFREEQQQNAKWSGLFRYVCSFLAYRVGSPSKVKNYTRLWLRWQCVQAGLWLTTCHITSIILIFRATDEKIWGWRLWYWMPSRRWAWLVVLGALRNVVFLLVVVSIHYGFSYLIPRQQRSPFHTRNLTFHYRKYTATARCNRKVSNVEVATSAK
jgi:hypothetical protein